MSFERTRFCVTVNSIISMLLSMILLAVVTLGGAAMTYIVSEDEPLMWRIAAGCVAGSAVCGTVAFILGLAFGLTPVTAAVSIAAALL